MPNKITRAEITTLRDDLAALEDSYLRQKGWLYIYDFPDSRWRWYKVLNGKGVAVNTEDALALQDAVDEDYTGGRK